MTVGGLAVRSNATTEALPLPTNNVFPSGVTSSPSGPEIGLTPLAREAQHCAPGNPPKAPCAPNPGKKVEKESKNPGFLHPNRVNMFDVAGFRVDLGSHRLNPDMPDYILADLRALLGSDLQTRYRNGRLLLGERWVTYPFKPRELAKSMPAVPMARAAFEALATTWRGKKQAEAAQSYAELMRAGFGPTMYREVYEPYAAKLWGVSGDEIDADQTSKLPRR